MKNLRMRFYFLGLIAGFIMGLAMGGQLGRMGCLPIQLGAEHHR